MDDSHFDDLARAVAGPSRRGLLATLGAAALGGVLGALGLAQSDDVGAESGKCKKDCGECERCEKGDCDKKNGRKRCNPGKCKAKKDGTLCSGGTCQNGTCLPALCGGVICPEGQVCCQDEKCGPRCCANGRACDVACCGPNGNDYCCDASRPVCICGGCWQAGSTQCADPRHCCSPNQRCCGSPPYDHCCAEGWECKIGCGGNPQSATCCKSGAATCCPDGQPA